MGRDKNDEKRKITNETITGKSRNNPRPSRKITNETITGQSQNNPRPIKKNYKRNNVQANRETITGQSQKIKNETITGKSQNNYWPISKLYAAKKNSEGQCVPYSCIIYGVAYSEV